MGHYPCCCSCLIFNDTFDADSDTTDIGSGWTEEVGDWELDATNDVLQIGTTGAVALTTAQASNEFMSAEVTCGATTSNGDKVRVYICATDEDNAYFGQIEFSPGGGNSVISLWKVNAGTETELTNWGTSAISSGTDYVIRVCSFDFGGLAEPVVDDRLTITVELASNGDLKGHWGYGQGTSESFNANAYGRKAGLGTGDTLAATIDFDDFNFNAYELNDEVCAVCGCQCRFCDPSVADGCPDELTVEFSGIANGAACSTCDADYNDTFVVSWLGENFYDGAWRCIWSYQSSTSCFQDILTVELMRQSGNMVLQVYWKNHLTAPGEAMAWVSGSVGEWPDCTAFNETCNENGGAASFYCDPGYSTCTVTS